MKGQPSRDPSRLEQLYCCCNLSIGIHLHISHLHITHYYYTTRDWISVETSIKIHSVLRIYTRGSYHVSVSTYYRYYGKQYTFCTKSSLQLTTNPRHVVAHTIVRIYYRKVRSTYKVLGRGEGGGACMWPRKRNGEDSTKTGMKNTCSAFWYVPAHLHVTFLPDCPYSR